MKFKFSLITLFVSVVFNSSAQFFQGLRSSPFGGVTNVNYNPAIADNRFVADINILNFGFNASNNYVGLDRRTLYDNSLFTDPQFQDKYLRERVNGRDKSGYVGLQSQLPLSFMFSFGKKKNKNALALTYHSNLTANVDNVHEKLVRISYHGLGYKADSISPFRKVDLQDKHISLKAMGWVDYGITYSRVVLDKDAHFLKVGGTLKLIQGLLGGYMYVKDINYRWENYDTLSIFQTKAEYNYSQGAVTSSGYDFNNVENSIRDYFRFTFGRPSFAGDLGVIYEWRPDKEKYKYQMDCEDRWLFQRNRYKLAAGFSVIDIGGVRFKSGQYSGSFNADIQNWDVGGAKFTDGLQSLDDTIMARFVRLNTKEYFTMWLPTRFNMFVDYHAGHGFGVNLNTTVAPNLSPKRNMVHHLTTVTLTPKYDHAWFGLYLPLSYDVMNNINWGATLRLGPIIVGTQDILGLFAKKHIYNTDVHVALKIPIPYRKVRDRDKDGVSNRKDECKKAKGPCITKGCPDKDNDGIVDDLDRCPELPGIAELRGCPDADGDGIADPDDSCMYVKGIERFYGCPDTDNDGVPDKDDECPQDSGVVALKGCPDRDGDGVTDRKDDCPETPGDPAHAGCPDTDVDGLYDNEDKCIREKGPRENNGCPYPDRDGDGVLDKDDECPTVFGVPENKGCPKLEKKELDIVQYAFENLEFETGKDIIRPKSYASLNSLAELLKTKPNYGLLIEGHTDNVGSDASNLILSQKRANAVKNYLIKRGVDGSKLDAFGYGESRPIATNDTPEGRQRNRRVEMKITFK
ncbi:MAG: DUF5723 family protein [Chitinophagales bacterium]|nr:DUF5723 family protein [Chitinophagales bacterium]MDW8418808.1 DUF5723 family protein [Chitinophagales bacterium]